MDCYDNIWFTILVLSIFRLYIYPFTILFQLMYRDFASDVNLFFEIWITENILDTLANLGSGEEQTRSDIIILAVAIGSGIFVIIPYIANLIVAVKIKSFIKTNEAAKAWYDILYFC